MQGSLWGVQSDMAQVAVETRWRWVVLNSDPTVKEFGSDSKEDSCLGVLGLWGQAQKFVVVSRHELSSRPLALGILDLDFCEGQNIWLLVPDQVLDVILLGQEGPNVDTPNG